MHNENLKAEVSKQTEEHKLSLDDLKIQATDKQLKHFMKLMSHVLPKNEKEKSLRKKKNRTRAKLQKKSRKSNRG